MKKKILFGTVILIIIGIGELIFLTGCKKDPVIPTLTTTSASGITLSTATSGGNITSDGGAEVTARGVCWGTSTKPTVTGTHTTDSKGVGTFTSSIAALVPNTLYYVRAYATNSAGTAYGNEVTFTTSPIVVGTLTTTAVTSITSITAVSGGSITADGGGAITARGVCWNTSTNPTTANNKTTDGTGTGSFVSNLTSLQPGTTYYVRAFAVNSAGTAYGNELTFSAAAITPTITTTAVSGITVSTATSGGNITSDGGSAVSTRGLCWGAASNPTITGSHTTDGTGTGSFTTSLTGLTPNTTYYLRAYATNTVGTAYGNEVSFTTSQVVISTLTTTAVTSITSTTAVSGGNITADGGGAVTARGVCWATTANPTISNSKTADGTGTGSFASNLAGLLPGTTYYVKAYATNSAGTAYGNELIFTTAAVIPTLTTTAVSGITITTATSGGNITNNGGAAVTARGACWSTSTNPVITGSHTTDGTGNGSYTSSLAGLTANTTYYVRAYATNSVGTAYGNEVSFITTPVLLATLTTTAVTSITSTTAISGGDITADGGGAITARGVCWSTSTNPTIAGSHSTNGSGTGSFTSNLTGLSASTTYYVRAYATNGGGTAYGNQVSFISSPESGTLIDVENNVYNTVKIGTQWWMAENLRTTKYNDGTSIPNVTDPSAWSTLATDAYCWYDNNEALYKTTYGALYNWFSVNTGKLCPTGWHVPTDEEFKTLEIYLGMTQGQADATLWRGTDQGTKLKSTNGWISGGNGTNSSGFNGLPGGYRYGQDGGFYNIGMLSYWWSSTEYDPTKGFYRRVDYNMATIYREGTSKKGGKFIRCLKD